MNNHVGLTLTRPIRNPFWGRVVSGTRHHITGPSEDFLPQNEGYCLCITAKNFYLLNSQQFVLLSSVTRQSVIPCQVLKAFSTHEHSVCKCIINTVRRTVTLCSLHNSVKLEFITVASFFLCHNSRYSLSK